MQAPITIEAVPVFNWNDAGGWDSSAIWLPVAQQIETIFL